MKSLKMTRSRRKTNDNNIVIICEGADTEFLYFTEIKEFIEKHTPERFSKIRVLPEFKAKLDTGKLEKKEKRNLLPSKDNKKYYAQADELYEEYKAQPIRYVREAQLFMEREGYSEAWAVFDKDTYIEKNHQKAFRIAEETANLNIAFSSYCFEEWFLLHFELNPKSFKHSECKNPEGKYIGCGTHQNKVDDCHGTSCVIGRLREQNYIEKYGKSNMHIFREYTLPKIKEEFILPFFFAAKLRVLGTEEPYKRNPYSNVDMLVARLLECQQYLCCNEANKEFLIECDATKLKCFKNPNNSICICNVGNGAFYVNNQKIQYFKSDSTSFMILDRSSLKCVLKPNETINYTFQEDSEGICISGKKKKLFFFK